MNSLRDQLLSKGLVTAEAAKKAEQQKREDDARADKKKTKDGELSTTHLMEASTVGEFIDGARNMLKRYPEAIGEVVQAVHRYKGSRSEKEKRLYWICYEVQRRLPSLSKEQKDLLIDRAFRRKNPTPTLPGEKD